MEEDNEEDEADLYVNVARAGQEEDDWLELGDSRLELDGGESEDDGEVYCVNAFMGGEDSGLEEEFEYYPDVSPSQEGGVDEKSEEERWWTLDLLWYSQKSKTQTKDQ
jgi:hypothetical protein